METHLIEMLLDPPAVCGGHHGLPGDPQRVHDEDHALDSHHGNGGAGQLHRVQLDGRNVSGPHCVWRGIYPRGSRGAVRLDRGAAGAHTELVLLGLHPHPHARGDLGGKVRGEALAGAGDPIDRGLHAAHAGRGQDWQLAVPVHPPDAGRLGGGETRGCFESLISQEPSSFQGTTFPALNAILAKWVPMSERSRIGSLTFAGSLLGTVIGNAASGIVIEVTQDWASVFYLFGGFGLVWFIIWNFLCYSDPESHPFISDAEKTYLGKELSSVTNEKKSIPWKAMLTSVPLWALIAAQIGHDWGFYIMVTDLPKYMKDVLKFKISENGLWSAVPYVLMWVVSISSGWLCDWIIMKGYMSITFARKFFTTVASVCPAVFIIAASYSGCDRIATVIFFSIAMGFMGTFYCGMKVNALDLAPNFAGTAMAIVNGIGAITGIISPALIGLLTPDHALSQWRTVFWITLVILVVTNVIYIFFGSGKEQWWNEIGAAKPSKTTKYQATAGESVVKVYP